MLFFHLSVCIILLKQGNKLSGFSDLADKTGFTITQDSNNPLKTYIMLTIHVPLLTMSISPVLKYRTLIHLNIPVQRVDIILPKKIITCKE
jgi:hypothetical protein